jgi:Xaa-Pro aminopeptidase
MTAGVMLVKTSVGVVRPLLFVDDRYMEKAKAEAKRGVRVLHIDAFKEHIRKFRRVRFEAEDVTVARLARWKKNFYGTRFIPTSDTIENMRRAKKPEELRAIRKACRITDGVLAALPRLIRIGMSENTLGWEIEKLSHNLGADCMAFETIVAFGRNTSRPHHRPTTKKLKKGAIVQIDMGVKVNGYCSDCSRVFFTGKPTEEQKKIHALLVKIVKECTKRAKAEASNRALDKLARNMLKKHRLRTPAPSTRAELGAGRSRAPALNTLFLHSLGHGVGLELHEGVNLSLKAKNYKLKAREVVTIEPGVYFPGKWGMRIEDTILVTRRGGRNLTHVMK